MSQIPVTHPMPAADHALPLIPVRMVNEYEYCPRLAYLEWVQGEWAESADTVYGKTIHKRVDKPGGTLPAPDEVPEGDQPTLHARSVTLESLALGLVGKLDLIEAEDGQVVPVDYKKGKRPHVARGAYEPERVQVCAQGLLLREHGYRCDHGVIYFAGSRERVTVDFDEELIARTQAAIEGLRVTAASGVIPPPLIDSPKCPRCSLVGICLPDEVNFLLGQSSAEPRPLMVRTTEAFPLHVQSNQAKVAKSGDTLTIEIEDQPRQTVRINEVSQLLLQGNVYVTTGALHELMRRDIPIVWASFGGWYLGHTQGVGHKNVELRTAQYRASFDEAACLELARGWVVAKVRNQKVFLRRNWRGDEPPDAQVQALEAAERNARVASSMASLLGFEGAAAAAYFGSFDALLRKDQDAPQRFDFTQRNRRPPRDPVNALLSLAYSMLVRQYTQVLASVGFDPFRGYYHQPRFGRPSLALDMMEPFRPVIADSAVIKAINNGEVKPSDFITVGVSCNLREDGRKRFIAGFERRMDEEVTHPQLGYKLSYRRLLELQARLLGRYLSGELDSNPNFIIR